MFETWKFSKGIILTSLVTGATWLLLLGFAYRQHRASEILSGVIAGLTVILGILTAEWLRSSREQVELARSRFNEIGRHLERFLVNFEIFWKIQYSREGSFHWDDFYNAVEPMELLARTTRWPQPNAKKIREVAGEKLSQILAMVDDAEEYGYIWDIEKRMAILFGLRQLQTLIWARTPADDEAELSQRIEYRVKPPKARASMRVSWVKESSNE